VCTIVDILNPIVSRFDIALHGWRRGYTQLLDLYFYPNVDIRVCVDTVCEQVGVKDYCIEAWQGVAT